MQLLKFSKYLREFGWEPTILTVENGSASTDISLEKDIPEGLRVVKTKTGPFSGTIYQRQKVYRSRNGWYARTEFHSEISFIYSC